ncbi:lysophospholipid acyltransferase family protein [Cytobacillus purgationiresistens]|uniref:1-acyl-sn-glycerol-3-phosphate acyltransferase n=1 Tax=Cytobacillus purgationiresistens TaxID=863449 RepID=A0ABU0ANJ1_9BACI|nr:1-acyl-sn-glycerol-3-phosphate acyltransferase [Cytobacillus purgationiresistens]MDQ0272859.1 1-acyl-sn-glycerol-3-phosphate acyltransferase [Cytobacillus purgationiresistens]
MYKLCSTLIYILMKTFHLFQMKGKENIPSDERYVVTCSHKSIIDVIVLAIALYPTPVHFMAKKELFEGKFRNRFFRSIKAFPVNRENPGPSTLKTPLKILKDNKCVGIFPSGTRTSEDMPLKRGAVTIALKADAPLLPADYKGPTKISQFLKGEKSSIIFGEPMLFGEIRKLHKNEQIDAAVEDLEKEMKRLEKLH